MNPTIGKCLIRLINEADYPSMENIYTDHEGIDIPSGYFKEFRMAIRDLHSVYFVAETEGRILGGGGVSDYRFGFYASLVFGVIDRSKCRMGYGTAVLLARLYFVSCVHPGCRLTLQATEWSAAFFSRLGFDWHGQEEDEAGNRFLHGSMILYPHFNCLLKDILDRNEVVLDVGITDKIAEEQAARSNRP